MVAQEKQTEQTAVIQPNANQSGTRHFTVEEYYSMGQAGILAEDERVELIQGEIVQMPPIDAPHASFGDRLLSLIFPQVIGKAQMRVQYPILLLDNSSPQPDLALLRPRTDFYEQKHPVAADVYLLIEISDSTLAYDKNTKAMLYAQAGIEEYWILDVNNRLIIQHTQPSPTGFRLIQQLPLGKTITSTALPELTLSVDAIFGK